MAALPESETYDEGVYQVETTDAVIGGADGKSNASARNLANRTKWLKARVDALNEEEGRLLNVQIFNVAGTYTYTPSVGTKKYIVEVQGGGGAGGGNVATTTGRFSAGGGGGAGGYGKSLITNTDSTVTVTVGAGGVASFGGTSGGGGTSSFGAYLTCTGGKGLASAIAVTTTAITSSQGLGGTSTGGNIVNCTGQAGMSGLAISTNDTLSGKGGDSYFGAAGHGFSNITPAQSNGISAAGYGAGGGGSSCNAVGAPLAGGAGKNGIVIVWEYG